jgi:hypothetical protein
VANNPSLIGLVALFLCQFLKHQPTFSDAQPDNSLIQQSTSTAAATTISLSVLDQYKPN